VRLILDAGALVALERNDRAMWRLYKAALKSSEPPLSHGGAVGQVWRGRGPRHALLAKALEGIEVVGLDASLGRDAGELLARARTKDVIDAAVVLLARDGDLVLTSDPGALQALAEVAGTHLELARI
jgi:hypothetical protein